MMFTSPFTLARELWSAVFPPVPPILVLETNPIDFLIRPSLCMETDEFHYLCDKGVTSSTDFAKAETRFKVESVSVLKRNVGPGHEFLHVAVRDGEEHKDRSFILEKAVNEVENDPNEGIIEGFFDHEDGMKVFVAVLEALLDIPTSIIAPGAAVVAGPAGLSVSALGSPIVPLATTFVDEPSSDSVIDQVSLNVTRILDFFSERYSFRRVQKTLPKPNNAHGDDRWRAGDKIGFPEYGIVQGTFAFKPKHLNLLHMSMLATVVHNEFSLYSLFQNNCFWASYIAYICAKVIDFTIVYRPNLDLPGLEDLADSKDLIGMFYMPFQLYMPSVAGHYMGFKVSQVQKIVVHRIV